MSARPVPVPSAVTIAYVVLTAEPLDRGKRLASELPNARLEIIPGVGHAPHLERPAAVIPLLLDFYGR